MQWLINNVQLIYIAKTIQLLNHMVKTSLKNHFWKTVKLLQ